MRQHVTGTWKRIETRTLLGFPDTVALVQGVTSLVELKSKNEYLTGLGTTAIQRNFLDNWVREGGNAYLLARAEDMLYLVRGDKVLNDATVQEWLSVSTLAGPVKGFDWDRLNFVMGCGCRRVGPKYRE